jgi:RNA polymerase sigma-70 factor (ECF subfamily)
MLTLSLHESPRRVSPDAPAADILPVDAGDAFQRYGDFVFRSLQRLGVRDADLEDVMQEAFVVIGRQLGSFENKARLTTWLYGICLRVASDHRRRAWVRREVPTSEMPDGVSPESGPEASLEAARERRKLHAVLDLLDPEQRALLVMFELDEMSCKDIGEILGIPTGTVHSRLHAARQEFKTALRRWEMRMASPVYARDKARLP